MVAQLRRLVGTGMVGNLGFTLALDGAIASRRGSAGPSATSDDGRSVARDEPGADRGGLSRGNGGGDPARPSARDCPSFTGNQAGAVVSRGARLLWQGKVFEEGQATAVNRFFGMRVVRGQLYQGPSWLDGGPCAGSRLQPDFASLCRQPRRDPPDCAGLFLGLMYNRTTSPPELQMYFALEVPQ